MKGDSYYAVNPFRENSYINAGDAHGLIKSIEELMATQEKDLHELEAENDALCAEIENLKMGNNDDIYSLKRLFMRALEETPAEECKRLLISWFSELLMGRSFRCHDK